MNKAQQAAHSHIGTLLSFLNNPSLSNDERLMMCQAETHAFAYDLADIRILELQVGQSLAKRLLAQQEHKTLVYTNLIIDLKNKFRSLDKSPSKEAFLWLCGHLAAGYDIDDIDVLRDLIKDQILPLS